MAKHDIANPEVAGAVQPKVEQTDPYLPLIGRIPIRHLSPTQSENLWPAKAFSGEVVPFEATVFRDGHDRIGADLLLIDPDRKQTIHRMALIQPGLDLWRTLVQLDTTGIWHFRVQAWNDDWATWLHDAEIKVPLGQDVELVFADGAALLARAGASKAVKDAIAAFTESALSASTRLAAAHDARLNTLIANKPIRSLATLSEQRSIRVERSRAGVGSWYEFFPRSEGARKLANAVWQSGTFVTAAGRLPAIARMGFDVVYLPPIHPIGTSFRKGRNNTLDAGKNDPGSPWAIGSAAGGHDAINPDLGTVADFAKFLEAAKKQNLEVAIDLALQCSPDHPWVTQHPEWFTTRADGTIAYAENPPKKYQDIFPLNFDNDPTGLSEEILRIVRYWISVGIRIFRVDNPHTKPLWFWEWLIHEVSVTEPDVVFLAEAFTRPAMMQSLAAVGFQQSYSYFAWRNTKRELEEFLVEISDTWSDFYRPNLFVNTPDILTEYLQFGGHPAYKVRAALAATAAPTWGVYSGYELYEDVARPGSEENIDNEKYEYKPRDYAKALKLGASLAPYLTTLNKIRQSHSALRQLRNLTVHSSEDDSILVYSKFLAGPFTRSGRADGVIIVANVDPHSVRETTVHLDLTALGLAADATFEVTDLITEQKFTWGPDNYVRLDAFVEPVHILSVSFPKGM